MLLILLLCLPLGVGAQNRRLDRPPKLLVEIVMGSLSPTLIDAVWEELSPGGLPRIYGQGVVAMDARYPHLVCNSTNGLGTLVSGANPSRHGMLADHWYSGINGRRMDLTHDAECHAVGVPADAYRLSPHRMLVGTLAESWRKAFPRARIYSLSLTPTEALILGGRAANAALWLDPKTGRLTTSSYYARHLPRWAEDFNQGQRAESYNSVPWSQAEPGEGKSGRKSRREVEVMGGKYQRLSYVPSGASLLKDLAVQAVEKDRLGQGPEPDLLAVYHSALEGIAALYGPESPQMKDAVLRFNGELAALVDYLDATLGRKGYLLVLTSAYAAPPAPRRLTRQRIPAGTFNPDRAVLMLNSYLQAIHKAKSLVLGYANQSIFLNEPLIADRHLNMEELQNLSAHFLSQMSGVATVYPAHRMQWGGGNNRFLRAAAAFNPQRSGHLTIDLQPGWIVAPSFSPRAQSATSSYDPHVPLAFFGWKLPRKRLLHEVSMRDIVPTICGLYHIPVPNASEGGPLPGVANWDE
ncbi:MAG: hypothetical protein CSA07_03290 [Bacteroidia bacterium]|nr:MAG: hypothetical protein CSA07_03290 [Bacteroidia bacterium]